VWSDGAGRAGIRFSGLPDRSQRQLKEWLFVNLLIARTNYAARTGQVSGHVEERLPAPPSGLQSVVLTPVADLSGMLSAVEAVRREVRAAGDDFEAVIRLITERALSLTGSSGAALAFLTDDKMICRASVGEPALQLGTAVDVKQGISGECVRSGQMVVCEDTEADSRVDREICRMLGIGSILAAPILSDFRVVGLMEVFSPRTRAFTKIHEIALDRLVEIVPTVKSATLPSQDATANVPTALTAESTPTTNATLDTAWEPETDAQEPLKGVPVQPLHILLLVLTLAAVFLVAGYLSAPKIERLWLSKPVQAGRPVTASTGAGSAASGSINQAGTLENVRKRAEDGDPDAQWEMGARYRNGEGVPQDDARAVQWFQRAANQGHRNAQNSMGASYWAGRGVRKDLSQAYFWSVLAANQGDETSESRMQGLALEMTRGQVVAAQQQADDWLRQHRAAK